MNLWIKLVGVTMLGGGEAIVEQCEALLNGEKTNENQEVPGSPPNLGNGKP